MIEYPFAQVDAFTATPLEGNACAIVYNAEGLDDSQMMKIAHEMGLSETAFVFPSDHADFKLRFFSAVEEVPLAGHPTIATMHSLLETGRIKKDNVRLQITLGLTAGTIQVDVEDAHATHPLIHMHLLKPRFGDTYPPSDILPLFGLSEDDLLPGARIQTVNTGSPQLMIPLRDLETLRRARFNINPYIKLRDSADFMSPHLFCLQGFTSDGDTAARHFFPPPDIMEDPFTGSGNGNMAAYIWRYGLLDRSSFVAEQGHTVGRAGQAQLEVTGSPEAIERVTIPGRAVTIISGEFVV